MTIKHTPGPWKADSNPGCKTIRGGKERSGAHRQAQFLAIAYTVGLLEEIEDAANAKLIAAAPALADALENLVAVVDRDTVEIHAARAALRAAGRLP